MKKNILLLSALFAGFMDYSYGFKPIQSSDDKDKSSVSNQDTQEQPRTDDVGQQSNQKEKEEQGNENHSKSSTFPTVSSEGGDEAAIDPVQWLLDQDSKQSNHQTLDGAGQSGNDMPKVHMIVPSKGTYWSGTTQIVNVGAAGTEGFVSSMAFCRLYGLFTAVSEKFRAVSDKNTNLQNDKNILSEELDRKEEENKQLRSKHSDQEKELLEYSKNNIIIEKIDDAVAHFSEMIDEIQRNNMLKFFNDGPRELYKIVKKSDYSVMEEEVSENGFDAKVFNKLANSIGNLKYYYDRLQAIEDNIRKYKDDVREKAGGIRNKYFKIRNDSDKDDLFYVSRCHTFGQTNIMNYYINLTEWEFQKTHPDFKMHNPKFVPFSVREDNSQPDVEFSDDGLPVQNNDHDEGLRISEIYDENTGGQGNSNIAIPTVHVDLNDGNSGNSNDEQNNNANGFENDPEVSEIVDDGAENGDSESNSENEPLLKEMDQHQQRQYPTEETPSPDHTERTPAVVQQNPEPAPVPTEGADVVVQQEYVQYREDHIRTAANSVKKGFAKDAKTYEALKKAVREDVKVAKPAQKQAKLKCYAGKCNMGKKKPVDNHIINQIAMELAWEMRINLN